RLVVKHYARPAALTSNLPGLTRDVQVRRAELFGAEFSVADSPGFQQDKDETHERMRGLAREVTRAAGLVLFVVDGREPLNEQDWALAESLGTRGKDRLAAPCIVVVNKCESRDKTYACEAEVAALVARYGLNRMGGAEIESPIISASHGLGMEQLYDILIQLLPKESSASLSTGAMVEVDDHVAVVDDKIGEEVAVGHDAELEKKIELLVGDDEVGIEEISDDQLEGLAAAVESGEELAGEQVLEAEEVIEPDRPIRLVILGRPNVGKSTLTNSLLRREAVLTGPESGLTRDATYHVFSYDIDKVPTLFEVVDTAGIRRKARISATTEKQSVGVALGAMQFAQVVLLLIDARTPLEQQDMAIIKLVLQEGRPFCLVLNKWDLVENRQRAMSEVRRQASYLLPRVRDLPIMTLSASDGRGIRSLLGEVKKLYLRWSKRIDTSRLNRWLKYALEKNPPPSRGGYRAKINFAINIKSRPPHFVLFLTRKELIDEHYLRYLENSLRDEFEFAGVPIRFTLRVKKNPFAPIKK
ncbi:MAG: ribosome biogenesis GTPase Der, partial [Alphaproteobacteria bacterium]|nr:ribosome biogenesis GTPase Der [Alphaproteobacteria bacterium]